GGRRDRVRVGDVQLGRGLLLPRLSEGTVDLVIDLQAVVNRGHARGGHDAVSIAVLVVRIPVSTLQTAPQAVASWWGSQPRVVSCSVMKSRSGRAMMRAAIFFA